MAACAWDKKNRYSPFWWCTTHERDVWACVRQLVAEDEAALRTNVVLQQDLEAAQKEQQALLTDVSRLTKERNELTRLRTIEAQLIEDQRGELRHLSSLLQQERRQPAVVTGPCNASGTGGAMAYCTTHHRPVYYCVTALKARLASILSLIETDWLNSQHKLTQIREIAQRP